MATTNAHISVYREEFIPVFERESSGLRNTCVQEANISGKNAVFLVSGTASATATERGASGLIVPSQNSNTQNTCTLVDLNHLREGTKFEWDLSQSNQRLIAAQGASKALARKMDQQVVDQLDTLTVNTGSSATASLAMVQDVIATLGEANVPVEDEENMFALFSMKARGYLMQIPEFASADYVELKALNGAIKKARRWAGLNWLFYNGLTGAGTATEKCFIYHRTAIGHAMAGQVDATAGEDTKQNMYWARATAFAQAKLLQDSGGVMVYHNGL